MVETDGIKSEAIMIDDLPSKALSAGSPRDAFFITDNEDDHLELDELPVPRIGYSRTEVSLSKEQDECGFG